MNGSRVRGGEGRFITFYYFIFYTISFFILKKNTKVINLPSPPLTLDPFISAPFNSFLCSFDSFHHRGHGGYRGYNYL